MRIYLVRHGIAISKGHPACPADPERHLTREGIEKTRAAARGLRRLGIRPEVVLTSRYRRAAQTAEIFCRFLWVPVENLRLAETLKPDSDPARFFAELQRLKAEEVMCFGHGSNLKKIIAYAAGPKACREIKKAGVACLEIKSLTRRRGELKWVHGPKTLKEFAN